jgi:transposase
MDTLAKVFVGVDVSKKHLDVCIYPEGKTFKITNDKDGFEKMTKEISRYFVDIVVCEASGGYEKAMAKYVAKKGFKKWIVDPKRVKHFIAAEGVQYKTDKNDARMIALFASKAERRHEFRDRSENEEALKAFIKRRLQLVDMLANEKKHAQEETTTACKKLIDKNMSNLEKQIDKINKEIHLLTKKDSQINHKIEIAKSIPGIGQVIAATIVAEVPEMGTITNKQAAAMIGVAPLIKQSGTYVGKAHISGGRSDVRRAIYMAALTAAHSDPRIKKIYNKLIDAGKPPKVALVAVMRKLVVYVNTLFKKGEMWNEKFC